jgi:hypothetical protein
VPVIGNRKLSSGGTSCNTRNPTGDREDQNSCHSGYSDLEMWLGSVLTSSLIRILLRGGTVPLEFRNSDPTQLYHERSHAYGPDSKDFAEFLKVGGPNRFVILEGNAVKKRINGEGHSKRIMSRTTKAASPKTNEPASLACFQSITPPNPKYFPRG